MKIAIYKPFKPLYFVDDTKDNAAWSYEIVNTAHILEERGHWIDILSDNDIPGTLGHIASRVINGDNPNIEHYDRIIIWCGSFGLDKYGDKIIDMLRTRTDKLDLMLTDRALIPTDSEKIKLFDNVYLQGTKKIFGDNNVTGAMSELILYKHRFEKELSDSVAGKDIEFYFGGTERDRLDDYIEYVWRQGHVITTKSKFFNREDRVPRDEFMRLLDRAKYSVVITDVVNNKEHFISPRPYECYIHDIIPFFDYKYDPDGYYCDQDDFRRVHNYKEMREKMNFLNQNPTVYFDILAKQREVASRPDFVNGDYIYKKLQEC